MSTVYISPLDFQTIFVNLFAGSWAIFLFLSVITLSTLAGRFKLNDKVFLIILVLFGILMAPQLGGLYALMIIIVGLSVYYSIAKIFKG